MNLFDRLQDDEVQRLLAAGWEKKEPRNNYHGPDVEEWQDREGNLFSPGGAIAELNRREGSNNQSHRRTP